MIARGPGGLAPRASALSRLARAGIVLAAGLAACARPPANPPDLILAGGRVYTLESDRPWAEAVAVRGEAIVKVGRPRSAPSRAPRPRSSSSGGASSSRA